MSATTTPASSGNKEAGKHAFGLVETAVWVIALVVMGMTFADDSVDPKKNSPKPAHWILSFRLMGKDELLSQYQLQDYTETPQRSASFSFTSDARFEGQGYTKFTGTWNPHVEIQGKVRSGYVGQYVHQITSGSFFIEEITPELREGWTWYTDDKGILTMGKRISLRKLP